MKLLIAGSRSLKFSCPELLLSSLIPTITGGITPLEIVSGGCNTGPDKWTKEYCKEFRENYKEFEADWDTYGRADGPIRNRQMAEYADKLLLIWDGESRGSKNMKSEMLKQGKEVVEIIIKVTEEE